MTILSPRLRIQDHDRIHAKTSNFIINNLHGTHFYISILYNVKLHNFSTLEKMLFDLILNFQVIKLGLPCLIN
jgi:hypothetical protein